MKPRRRGLIVAVALVALALIVTAVTRDDKPSRTRRSTTTTTPSAPALRITTPPTSYRIVYRVENLAGHDRIISTDEVWVRRPFAGRSESRAGEPPGGEVSSTTVSDFGLLSIASANAKPLVLHVLPGGPVGDLRLDAALTGLVDDGVLRPLPGRRSILGRACQEFRSGEPIGAGTRVRATATSYSDACIDSSGLVLAETWRDQGKVLRRRQAVEVETDVAVPDEMLQPAADPLPVDQGGGAVASLAPTYRPLLTYWELADSPEGFTYQGRYRVTTGSPSGGGQPASTEDTFVDLYVRGPDYVLVTQGRSDKPIPNAAGAHRVRLGRLPAGMLLVTVSGPTVLSRSDSTHYVRVSGTVSPDEMVKIAAALVPTGDQPLDLPK